MTIKIAPLSSFFVFILLFNITIAQDSIPCAGLYSDAHTQVFYNRILEKTKLPDSIIFSLGADSLKIQKFYDWAKIDGYIPIFYFSEYNKLKSARIAKKIEVLNLDFFSKEMQKIMIKREEYQIEDCGIYMVK